VGWVAGRWKEKDAFNKTGCLGVCSV